MKRIFLLFFCGVVFLSSCGGGKNAQERWEAFCARYPDLPSGVLYLSGKEEWEAGYMSPTLAATLFDGENGENALALCEHYAVYLLAGSEGGEVGFFDCFGNRDAARVAEACRGRIARLRRVFPDSPLLEGACVIQEGERVTLLLLPDNEKAREILKACR